MKYIRTIIFALVLSLVACVPCFAQVLFGADNFACFVVNDNWRKISVNDNVTTEIITIAYGRDTIVGLKRGKNRVDFRELKNCSDAYKKALANDCINKAFSNLGNQGFAISVSNLVIIDNSINIGYICSKNGKTYKSAETYVVKDYQPYSLVSFFTEDTTEEVFNAISNLFVGNVGNGTWFDWIK